MEDPAKDMEDGDVVSRKDLAKMLQYFGEQLKPIQAAVSRKRRPLGKKEITNAKVALAEHEFRQTHSDFDKAVELFDKLGEKSRRGLLKKVMKNPEKFPEWLYRQAKIRERFSGQ